MRLFRRENGESRLARSLLNVTTKGNPPGGGAWRMARQPQRKVMPARKSDRPREEDSLLIRSAESLGRVIGSLQRQLRAADLPDGDAVSTLRPPRKTPRKRATARAASKKSARSAKAAKPVRKSRSTKKTKRR